jgi:hypothetical protein
MKIGNMGLALAGITLLASGCKLVDKVKDAVDGENDSYCEAVCDWAVSCADGSSDLNADEMMSRCIEQTEAADPGCGGAEDGLAIEDAALLNECTSAQRAQDCDALTGSETQIMGGHPPALVCIAGYGGGTDAIVGAIDDLPSSAVELVDVQVYSTYNVARNAVMETGSEVCERFEESMCGYMYDCLEDKAGTGVDASTQDTIIDECVDRVFGGITDRCISSGQYDSFLPIDYNLARYSAMECMDDWDETASSDGACAVFTSTPAAICAGAFTTPEQVTQVVEAAVTFALDFDVSL